MNIQALKRVVRRDDVAGRSIDGEPTLLSASGRRIHRLNESALMVWDLIGDEATVDGLTTALLARVDVEESQLRHDVQSALSEFARGSLLCTPQDVHREAVPIRDAAVSRHAVERPAISLGPYPVLESLLRIEFTGSTVPREIRELFADLAAVLEPLHGSSAAIDVDKASAVVIRIAPVDSAFSVTRNGHLVASASSIASLRRVVLVEVNAGPIAELSHSVGFHAGAVEFPHGVVVFPGISNAGKSTLVANLMLRGHGYLTDEAAAIDVVSGEILPFTKSLCIDPGAQALFPDLASHRSSNAATWDISPAVIGPGRLGSPGAPMAFVFPTFQPGIAVSWRELSPTTALTRLLENSFDFSTTRAPGAELLLDLAERVPCFELSHGGQTEHLEILDGHFGAAAR